MNPETLRLPPVDVGYDKVRVVFPDLIYPETYRVNVLESRDREPHFRVVSFLALFICYILKIMSPQGANFARFDTNSYHLIIWVSLVQVLAGIAKIRTEFGHLDELLVLMGVYNLGMALGSTFLADGDTLRRGALLVLGPAGIYVLKKWVCLNGHHKRTGTSPFSPDQEEYEDIYYVTSISFFVEMLITYPLYGQDGATSSILNFIYVGVNFTPSIGYLLHSWVILIGLQSST